MPGDKGLMPMPLNIAGNEMRIIEELMVAMKTPSVVLVTRSTCICRDGFLPCPLPPSAHLRLQLIA